MSKILKSEEIKLLARIFRVPNSIQRLLACQGDTNLLTWDNAKQNPHCNNGFIANGDTPLNIDRSNAQPVYRYAQPITAISKALQRRSSVSGTLLLLPALLLGGCATAPGDDAGKRTNASGLRSLREQTLQTAWSGRPYHALVEAFGSPSMVMSLPNHRSAKASIVVYGKADKLTNCIDSFTVVSKEREGEVVADYFCR